MQPTFWDIAFVCCHVSIASRRTNNSTRRSLPTDSFLWHCPLVTVHYHNIWTMVRKNCPLALHWTNAKTQKSLKEIFATTFNLKTSKSQNHQEEDKIQVLCETLFLLIVWLVFMRRLLLFPSFIIFVFTCCLVRFGHKNVAGFRNRIWLG